MNTKFIIAGLFFVFILLSGVWLSRTGRPLNVLILTIHKLISLAAVRLVPGYQRLPDSNRCRRSARFHSPP